MFLVEVLFEQSNRLFPTNFQQLNRPQQPPKETNRSENNFDSDSDINSTYGEDETEALAPEQTEQENEEQAILNELEPIKKYYVINKLKGLRNRLKKYNIQFEDLELFLKFADNLSTRVIIYVGSILIDNIERQIARLSNDKDSNKEI